MGTTAPQPAPAVSLRTIALSAIVPILVQASTSPRRGLLSIGS